MFINCLPRALPLLQSCVSRSGSYKWAKYRLNLRPVTLVFAGGARESLLGSEGPEEKKPNVAADGLSSSPLPSQNWGLPDSGRRFEPGSAEAENDRKKWESIGTGMQDQANKRFFSEEGPTQNSSKKSVTRDWTIWF